MKAMRFHDYGAPLQLDDVPLPEPAADQILIKVHAAAVNPFDLKVHAGTFETALPATPGLEAAGTVAATGSGVNGLVLGAAVYGRVSAGYAEFALASEDAVAPKPPALDDLEAAALPVAIETAYSTLFDIGGLGPGGRALILGGAGSVGSIAVQLAKWKGAFVAATASRANLDFLRSLGADRAIDYGAGPLAGAVDQIDVVLDTIGGESARAAFAVLRPGGILVSIVAPPPQDLAAQHGVRAVARFNTTDPLTIPKTQFLVAGGILKATVRASYPLAEANEAWRAAAAGHGRGKIVLWVAE